MPRVAAQAKKAVVAEETAAIPAKTQVKGKPAKALKVVAPKPKPSVASLGVRKKEHDIRGEQIGQPRASIIALEGPASIDTEEVQVVEGPNFKDEAEALAFNEDQLTILIHPSMEKNPEDPVMVAVNGRQCFIFRNKKSIIKRKYVERLARAHVENINQDIEAKEPRDFNRLDRRPAHRYPFTVIHDPNPMGSAWLQKILAEV